MTKLPYGYHGMPEEVMQEHTFEEAAEEIEEEKEPQTSREAFFEAMEIFQDAWYTSGPDAIIAAEEHLIDKWEAWKGHGRPIPCGICHKLECSH